MLAPIHNFFATETGQRLANVSKTALWGLAHGVASVALMAFVIYSWASAFTLSALMIAISKTTLLSADFAATTATLNALAAFLIGSGTAYSLGADGQAISLGCAVGLTALALPLTAPFALRIAFLVAASTTVYRRG